MQAKRKKRSKIPFFLILVLLLTAFLAVRPEPVLKLIYPLKYDELVFMYAKENGIDPYLVFSIIKAESNFDPDATSSRNARGLMQVTDKTGAWAAEKLGMDDFVTDDLYRPDANIKIGCWYIRQLMREFGSNINLVIAAYNAGSGNVSSWLKDEELSRNGEELVIIPFKETDNYLKRVIKYYKMYQKLYAKRGN